jgi:hypothetical protein
MLTSKVQIRWNANDSTQHKFYARGNQRSRAFDKRSLGLSTVLEAKGFRPTALFFRGGLHVKLQNPQPVPLSAASTAACSVYLPVQNLHVETDFCILLRLLRGWLLKPAFASP